MVRWGGSDTGCPNHVNWDLNPNEARVRRNETKRNKPKPKPKPRPPFVTVFHRLLLPLGYRFPSFTTVVTPFAAVVVLSFANTFDTLFDVACDHRMPPLCHRFWPPFLHGFPTIRHRFPTIPHRLPPFCQRILTTVCHHFTTALGHRFDTGFRTIRRGFAPVLPSLPTVCPHCATVRHLVWPPFSHRLPRVLTTVLPPSAAALYRRFATVFGHRLYPFCHRFW